MVNGLGGLGLRRFGFIGLGLCAAFALAPAHADTPDAATAAASALRAGQAGDAENFATRTLEAKDMAPLDRAHALLNRALAREQLGRRRDALADFDAAIALNALPRDESSRAFFDRGVSLDELGRTEEAITDYSAALKIAPSFAPALNNRGNAERRLGRLDDAKADYQASLAAGDPQKEYPYYGLGQIAETQGDAKGAAEDYRMALAANGKYALATQRLAALSVTDINLHAPDAKPPVVTASYETAAPDLRPAILGKAKARRIAPVETAPKPAASEGAVVQLGAFRDEATASAGWNKMVGTASGALDGLTPQIVAADIPGKGKFYRLRTAVAAASAFCAKLTAKGLACMPVRD
jgi:tetratricopeptide (TPR) repeat protein